MFRLHQQTNKQTLSEGLSYTYSWQNLITCTHTSKISCIVLVMVLVGTAKPVQSVKDTSLSPSFVFYPQLIYFFGILELVFI